MDIEFVNGIYTFIDENGVKYRYKKNDKYCYYTFILYEESAIENWRDKIDEVLQVPFCYCTHDKDVIYVDGKPTSESRKPHTHIIMVWDRGSTTYKHALELANRLGKVSILKNVEDVYHMYNYLIHDTPKCRQDNKYLYDINERVQGNNFDIQTYISLSENEKLEMQKQLILDINNKRFMDYGDFILYCLSLGDDWFKIARNNQKFFESIIKSNYFKKTRKTLFGTTTQKETDDGQHSKEV